MKIIAVALVCVMALGCASPGAPSSRPGAQKTASGVVPILAQVNSIGLGTPNMAWWITIGPDGSVSAQFGSSPGDILQLPEGTVDFRALYLGVLEHAETQRTEECPIPVAMHARGATSLNAVYVNARHLPQIMLKLDQQEWRYRLGGPIPPRLQRIRLRHPIGLMKEHAN